VSLTAWTVDFLVDARAGGFAVEQKLFDTLTNSLDQALRSDYSHFIDGEAFAERAWALSALADAGKFNPGYAAELARRAQFLDLEGVSEVALALARQGDTQSSTVEGLVERLTPPLRGTVPHTVRVRLGSELRTLALGPEVPLGRLVASAAEDGEVALEPGKDKGVLGVRAETTYVPAADGSRVAAQASGFVVSREWLRVQKGADVPPERVPLAQPGTTLALAVGDLVEEHVQVVNPEERHYVAVVVPLAAGMEPLNPKLATASSDATAAGVLTLEPTYTAFLDD